MKKTKNFFKYMPAVVFCLFIFMIPVLYAAVADSDFSPLEKRFLSQLPKPTAETVLSGEFGKNFETYLNDQMPFRTFFVGTNSYYDELSGRNGMNGIYSGHDDYLLVTPVEDKPTLDNNILYLSEFIETADIPTYVCAVPTSGYIYEDKLPLNHYEYKDSELINKMDVEFSALENTTFINITEKFRELSKSEQLYYKTDHHWTSLGAYECYGILGESMGFTPTTKESFSIESYQDFHGTNYSKSALWLKPSENIELWENTKRPDNSIKITISEGGEERVCDTLFFRDNLETDDKYTAYLDGNHALVTIENENSETDRTLLILRDSYAHCLAPFLADNYKRIILVDARYYKMPVSNIVREENVDEMLIIYSLDSFVNSSDIAGVF